MRFSGILLALCFSASVAFAGEVVVYNQKWTGKTLTGLESGGPGKGYVLVDLTNKKAVRISTCDLSYLGKSFTVDRHSDALIAEAGSSYTGITQVVHANERTGPSYPNTRDTVYLKGRQKLLQIGPSQQKQVAKVITGFRRFTQSDVITQAFEEHAITATFDSRLTQDTNANSRTIEEEVALLTASLKEAGYSER